MLIWHDTAHSRDISSKPASGYTLSGPLQSVQNGGPEVTSQGRQVHL